MSLLHENDMGIETRLRKVGYYSLDPPSGANTRRIGGAWDLGAGKENYEELALAMLAVGSF